MSSELEMHLVRIYGFADGRVKNPGFSQPIRVDDRTESDRFPLFCGMFVRFTNPDEMSLSIANLPIDDDVKECLTDLGATIDDAPQGNTVEIKLSRDAGRNLRRLAKLVRRVVGRGRRYSDRNWKWLSPRTATSLDRLADVLDQYKRQ